MAVKRRVFLSRAALRLVFAAGIAAWVAGCSDATRLSDPFADPFGGSPRGVDRAPTGAILEPRSVQSRAIQSSPLPPATDASSANAPPPRSMSAGQSALRAGRAGSYAHWSAEGGTPIVAAQGETAEMIAMRYGVPAEALLRVNGLTSAAQVRPGARLVIPVYRASAAPASPLARKLAPRAGKGRDKTMAPAKPARAAAESRSETKFEPTPQAREATTAKAEGQAKAARAGDAQGAAALVEKSSLKTPGAREPDAKPADAAHPEFRWPARGRIIQGFNSGGNDGINIAVPEGTQVKAAEGGVVAYAGNELRGYGNLVLIRHPNGFVTAYAHNGELDVRRGDQVKRGQTIARSGQTGNVGSPQLHFELRKGSTPVDPTNYLAGL